jgi:hypothetical protein
MREDPMAKTTITSVSDDIDGTPDAETVTFEFQGVAYSIDLAQKNLDKLTKSLAPFIDNATRQRGSAGRSPGAKVRSRRRLSAPTRSPTYASGPARTKSTCPNAAAVVEQYLAAGRH